MPTPRFFVGQTDYIQQLNLLDAVAQAAKGDTGPTGPVGLSTNLTIGTVTTGTAAATITGTSPAQILNLVLPQGPQGEQGIQGEQGLTGPANTLSIGTVTTGTAAATVTGTAPNQTLNLVLPTASPNTLAIGTVTSGTAAATITGTAPNQTLNLVLQPGARGVTPRGAWAAGTAYVVDDLALYLGSTYRRLVSGTTATVPASDATNWQMFAQKGTDGTGSVVTVNSIAPDGSGNVVVIKSDIGLGNVEDKSSATIRGELTGANVTTALTYTPVNPSVIGAASGVAPLNASTKIDTAYLPTTDGITEGATNKYFTESRVLASVLTGLSLATNAAITATDSVLSAAGKLQKQITDLLAAAATKTGVETLTNKRITARVGTLATGTPAPDGDTQDLYTVTALAAGVTVSAPTGTPTEGQKLTVRIKDNGTARAIAWAAIYRGDATELALPTTTVISKTLYAGFIYNATDTKWDLVAVRNNL